MGKQVGFYAVGRDHEELLQRIDDLGLLALPWSVSTDRVPEAVAARELPMLEPAWRSYLVPRELDLSSIRYVSMKPPPMRRLEFEHSPVVELVPSRQVGIDVHKGRLYFAADRRTAGHDLAEKRYDSLARWVRRWPGTDQARFYVGLETAARAQRGELRLMDHKTRLLVATP
jgi:hypothetical protein